MSVSNLYFSFVFCYYVSNLYLLPLDPYTHTQTQHITHTQTQYIHMHVSITHTSVAATSSDERPAAPPAGWIPWIGAGRRLGIRRSRSSVSVCTDSAATSAIGSRMAERSAIALRLTAREVFGAPGTSPATFRVRKEKKSARTQRKLLIHVTERKRLALRHHRALGPSLLDGVHRVPLNDALAQLQARLLCCYLDLACPTNFPHAKTWTWWCGAWD